MDKVRNFNMCVFCENYQSRQSEFIVLDKSFFQKHSDDPSEISAASVPIKFCPECGRRLGNTDPNEEKVIGISDRLRNELRALHEGGCTDSDIEDFIREKRLSKTRASAVWTQIYVWMAPECCRGCKYVWNWRSCNCSRPYADKFERRHSNE